MKVEKYIYFNAFLLLIGIIINQIHFITNCKEVQNISQIIIVWISVLFGLLYTTLFWIKKSKGIDFLKAIFISATTVIIVPMIIKFCLYLTSICDGDPLLFKAIGLFILFPVSLIGLVIDFWISKKIRLFIFISSLVLLVPYYTIYNNYVVPLVYPILLLLALACLFSFFLQQIENKNLKIKTSIMISVLLFFILGLISTVIITVAH